MTMAVDKKYCMSSFLAFRYIYDDGKDFKEGLKHRTYKQHSDLDKKFVNSASDIDCYLKNLFTQLRKKKMGILLSGGMDSAILASYMSGCDAYTFRFLNGFQIDELRRAESFAIKYGLKLHYVDISWGVVERNVDILMTHKNAPVHSIEPQIFEAARIAKKDGIEVMIIGDAADYVFYGMDGLLSKDWSFEEFYERCIYIDPKDVLNDYSDMHYVFEKYRKDDGIDFLGMYDSIITDESYASYDNAFCSAKLDYCDPYELLKMASPIDLARVRKGESKYLIRELFKMRYPEFSVPEKNPMPRPVDLYFQNWAGPTRPEFKKSINISKYNGNQKWLLWVLERFLNLIDSGIDVQ